MAMVKLIIIGAGNRGDAYAALAKSWPERVEVVGVAEPREFHRERLRAAHGIPAENAVGDWRELAARGKFADAAVVATSDALHVEPTLALAAKGYHILLEKPMAPTEAECRRIVAAVKDAGVIFAVCHVLRYTPYIKKFKELLDGGVIGDLVSVQHLEAVTYWHQAHSFVRGNWRNSGLSSPMILAKSCHDMDLLRYLVGRKCRSVSSFGSLRHFKPENRPAGAASRCVECACERSCPYSAVKIYVRDRAGKGNFGWPVDVISAEPTLDGVWEALRGGPYGRCVYACDNDVVDHQVVNLLFDDEITCSFTMTAFTPIGDGRHTRFFGTRGMLRGDGSKIFHHDFLSDTERVIDIRLSEGNISDGHGGGDSGVMDSFLAAVAANDQTHLISGADETLESHLLCFAAEESRRTGKTVELP